MEEIKYILWDIDGTLIDFDYAEKEGLKQCFKKFGLGILDKDMLEVYKEINKLYWRKFEKGEISKEETLYGRFKDFFNLYKIDTSIIPEFNKEYQICMGNVARFNRNAKEVVFKLMNKYKQYAATNGTIEAQKRKLSNSGLIVLLNDIFVSEEIGFDKPSVKYFQEVFNRVGSTNSSDYLLIGDSLTSDILGGKNAGIKTCWYNQTSEGNKYGIIPNYEIHDLSEVLDILEYQEEVGISMSLRKKDN